MDNQCRLWIINQFLVRCETIYYTIINPMSSPLQYKLIKILNIPPYEYFIQYQRMKWILYNHGIPHVHCNTHVGSNIIDVIYDHLSHIQILSLKYLLFASNSIVPFYYTINVIQGQIQNYKLGGVHFEK